MMSLQFLLIYVHGGTLIELVPLPLQPRLIKLGV
jgi:hypothetical protein